MSLVPPSQYHVKAAGMLLVVADDGADGAVGLAFGDLSLIVTV